MSRISVGSVRRVALGREHDEDVYIPREFSAYLDREAGIWEKNEDGWITSQESNEVRKEKETTKTALRLLL